MTIDDVKDLNEFLTTDGGIITAPKRLAVRMVARQVTDRDLKQLLNKVAYQMFDVGCTWKGDYLGKKGPVVRTFQKRDYSDRPYPCVKVIFDPMPEITSYEMEPTMGCSSWDAVDPDAQSLRSQLEKAKENSDDAVADERRRGLLLVKDLKNQKKHVLSHLADIQKQLKEIDDKLGIS